MKPFIRIIFKIIIPIMLNQILFLQALAKDCADIKQGWLNLGFCFAGSSNFFGGGAGANLSYLSNAGLFSIRFIYLEQAHTMEPASLNNFQIKQISELSGLYGLSTKSKWFLASLSSGFGIIIGKQKTNNEEHSFSTVGLPLESQLFIRPLPAIGFGITIFANVNSKKSYTGILFCLQLGKLK